MSSGSSGEEEEEIGSSSSKKSSLQCRPSKIKKIRPKSVREVGKKMKQSNKEIVQKLGKNKIAVDAKLTETDQTKVCIKTVVTDRTVKVKLLSPKKSSNSSSETRNLRKRFFSPPSLESQKSTQTFSKPSYLPDSRQKLFSSTRIRTSKIRENSKNIKMNFFFEKNDKLSKNQKSSAESQNRNGASSSSLDAPDSIRKLSSPRRIKNRSAKNSKKIIDENSEIPRRKKKSSKNREEKDLFFSSSLSDVPSSKNIFSSPSVERKITASSEGKQKGGENNCWTERDENVEKESFHEKMNKGSWKGKFATILESSNNVEGDFTRDVEVTREALPIIDDIADLEEFSPRPQNLGVPDSSKERANVVEYVETTRGELLNIDSRVEVPIIGENRLDDESIDRSDDESGELHVCRDNLKTYPPRWADVTYIGTRVPRILKRPDNFFRTFEKSLVAPPPKQTQSPSKIKFHPSANYRANQMWDEFVSSNPEIFTRNASSNSPGTNEEQNTRKRKFSKTDRNTRLGLDKSETQKAPIPPKKHKNSGTKRARKVDSSSPAPKMVTIDGSDFEVKDRNIYEISSDSDDESGVNPQKSADQTRRSRTARNRHDRLTEVDERSVEASIEDFPSRSRSPSRRRRPDRAKQATEKRSKKPIDEDQYRSKSPDRRSSVTRSRFDDCVENQSSNVWLEAGIAEDRCFKGKINEASQSRSVAAKDRRSKSSRLEDHMEIWNEPEIMRSSEVRLEAAIAEDRRSKRKINEASRSRSVSGNDRQPKRLGFAERMRRLRSTVGSSSTIIRSPACCDDPFCDLGAQNDRQMAEAKIGKSRSRVFNPLAERIGSRKGKNDEAAVSKRSVEELSGSRSVLGNDRGRKILPFEKKNQRTESTGVSSSAIIRSSDFHDDPFCDLGAQKDRQMAELKIGKSPDLMANVRDRSKVVNALTGKMGSRKAKDDESAVSKRSVEELSGSRSVLGNDRGRKILPFEKKMQRTKSTAVSSSAIIFDDDPFCNLGARKDRQMAELKIGKSPDLMTSVRARSRVVNALTVKIGSRKGKDDESAISKTKGKSNREIESLYDDKSAIVDLNSAIPKKIFKTLERMDLIIEETNIRDLTKSHRNRGDFSTRNRPISASRRSLPMIRSDVALPAGRVNRIGSDRWEIDQPSTSIQISR